MMRTTVLSIVVLVACTTAGFADRGTPEEQAACRRDTVKLCKGVAPEDGPMLNCLQTNKDKLSDACRTVLQNHHQL